MGREAPKFRRDRMNQRRMQAAVVALALAACSGSAPAANNQAEESAVAGMGKPFTTRAITTFGTPWAMGFLPEVACR